MSLKVVAGAFVAVAACVSAPLMLLRADSGQPSDSTMLLAASTAPATVDSEEAMIEELRRRAMEASGEGDAAAEGQSQELAMSIEDLDAMTAFPGNLSALPAHPPYPADNQPTAERIELGRKLYFDLRLSRDKSMSCASCHDPDKGWADCLPRAIGFGGHELGRHSPTVINTAYNTAQFWDGRAATLEEQAVGPIMAAGEMAMQSTEEVLKMISEAPEYQGAFESAYGSGPSMDNIGRAIAAFERQVVTGPSPFDKYMLGDKSALTESEKRGMILFTTTASCTACHSGPNFTDSKFHALGVKQAGPLKEDLGRFAVTNDPKDKHGFKTPGLRNIEQSAPYMHDGSLETLEDVVDFYNRGGVRTDIRSNLIQPLNLSDSQKADLVAFLRSLTGPLPTLTAPEGASFGK